MPGQRDDMIKMPHLRGKWAWFAHDEKEWVFSDEQAYPDADAALKALDEAIPFILGPYQGGVMRVHENGAAATVWMARRRFDGRLELGHSFLTWTGTLNPYTTGLSVPLLVLMGVLLLIALCRVLASILR